MSGEEKALSGANEPKKLAARVVGHAGRNLRTVSAWPRRLMAQSQRSSFWPRRRRIPRS